MEPFSHNPWAVTRGESPMPTDKRERVTFTVLEQTEVLFVGWASS